jgi:hypothetical protein
LIGGAFGTLKLIRSVTINGNGNGNIRIYLDGRAISRNLSEYFISGGPVYIYTGESGYWQNTSLQSGMTVFVHNHLFRNQFNHSIYCAKRTK